MDGGVCSQRSWRAGTAGAMWRWKQHANRSSKRMEAAA